MLEVLPVILPNMHLSTMIMFALYNNKKDKSIIIIDGKSWFIDVNAMCGENNPFSL